MDKFSRWQVGKINETSVIPTYVYLLDNNLVSFDYWWRTLVIEMYKYFGLLKTPLTDNNHYH